MKPNSHALNPRTIHQSILWLLICFASLLISFSTCAGTVIGNWQNNSGDGWIDWPTGDAITNSAVSPSIYSFASGVVGGYSQSLQIKGSGNNQNLAIKLENIPGGMAAFLTNNQLSFTFSVPSAANSGVTAGYSQLYAVSINAYGYGFSNQPASSFTASGDIGNNSFGNGGLPNFNFSATSPPQSQVVTLNYSSILPQIAASNSATSGYIEIVFTFNNGGGAPTNIFMNNVVLGVPPPTPGVVIGSWQENTNVVTDWSEGWIDKVDGDNIAWDPWHYILVPNPVSGYAQSLQITATGYEQDLMMKLEYLPGGMDAFLTNHLLSFTFSVPPAAPYGSTGGWSQLYSLSINAAGYGWIDQSATNFTETGDTNNNSSGPNGGLPNFYFYANSPAQSQVVTLNYSKILPTIAANNSDTNGYIELIFAFNPGGGAPTNFFVNNVVLWGGAVTTPPQPFYIVTTNGGFGFANHQFRFTVNGPAGSNAVISASTDLKTWLPLATNQLVGGTLNFTDVLAPNFANRYYRATLRP
jgi:hypothetical protein